MDFDRKIESIKDDLKSALNQLKTAKKETFTFLKKCEAVGIKCVSIGKRTKRIKSSESWPFSADDSVFAEGRGKDGWPLIWKVASGGCGNHDQHSNDNSKLIDGVYELRAGKWYPVS